MFRREFDHRDPPRLRAQRTDMSSGNDPHFNDQESPYMGGGGPLVPSPVLVDPSEVRAEWRALAARSGNVFASFEWAEAWWRHFGGEKERLTALCRGDDGDPLAILPLYLERRGPVRIVRFIGDGVGDELGPICAPEHAAFAGDALSGFLAQRRGQWDLLFGRSLAGSPHWSRLLSASVVNRQGSPVVDLHGRTWDDFVSGRSKHFRRRVFDAERCLRQRHGLRFRLVTDTEELPAALDALFDLHRQMRQGRPSSFLRVEPFHRDFIACALEATWLRLRILELDDRPAAAVLDYSYGGVVSGYQLGMDPRWRGSLHLRLLITNSIRAACAEGARAYRLGRGDHSYKRQFADADPSVETVVLGRGIVGSTLAWAMYRARRARPVIRRLQRAVGSF